MSSVLLRKRVIIRGSWAGKKYACISFDCDFPEDMEACEPIVNFLNSKDIPASFAIPGHLTKEFPNVVDSLLKNGHEIVNHTLSHFPKFRDIDGSTMENEVSGFQAMMKDKHGYVPKGFRCPHGLRKMPKELLATLKKNNLYDSSLLGYGILCLDGLLEIPLTPCPEHPYMAFDSYHHFRFPFLLSSEEKMLRLWQRLLNKNSFANIFLDPLDFVTEIRLKLLNQMIDSGLSTGFQFVRMDTIHSLLNESYKSKD